MSMPRSSATATSSPAASPTTCRRSFRRSSRWSARRSPPRSALADTSPKRKRGKRCPSLALRACVANSAREGKRWPSLARSGGCHEAGSDQVLWSVLDQQAGIPAHHASSVRAWPGSVLRGLGVVCSLAIAGHLASPVPLAVGSDAPRSARELRRLDLSPLLDHHHPAASCRGDRYPRDVA